MSSWTQTRSFSQALELTPERVARWGVMSGISVLDQALVSGAGFLLNFLLARWLNNEVYGAFAVGFATLLFLSGFHNVLLLEPMSVMGPSLYVDRTAEYLASQWKIHQLISAVLATMMLLVAVVIDLLHAPELALTVAASGCALPFFLMLWLVRRMAYMVQRPLIAAWASAGYFVVIAIGTMMLHHWKLLSPAAAFVLMGIAGLVSATVPMFTLKCMHSESKHRDLTKTVLRENWNYGRWLLLSTALFSIVSQVQTYVVAGMLGLGAAGGFRAMQIPSVLMSQIVTAMGLLILPSMSYEFGIGEFQRLRKKACMASGYVTLLSLGYAGILAISPETVEHWLYAGKYSQYADLIPILALVPVFTGLSLGLSMAQRASQQPQFDLLANSISAPVGLLGAVLLIRTMGVKGASVSLVTGFAVYAAVFCWVYKYLPRQANELQIRETCNP